MFYILCLLISILIDVRVYVSDNIYMENWQNYSGVPELNLKFPISPLKQGLRGRIRSILTECNGR